MPILHDRRRLRAWYDRIRSVPSARISELCEQCREYGLTADEATAATDFLVHRQQNLASIVANHKTAFTGMVGAAA